MSVPVLRFAPSPNGFLHLGHAASALHNQRIARRLGGKVLLRIEDIDVGRTREEFVSALMEDLEWIGFEWDGEVRRQSEHFEDYQDAAKALADAGLLYPCFATRSEIDIAARRAGAERDPDGAFIYPGLWRGKSEAEVKARRAQGEAFAMRIDMEKAVRAAAGKVELVPKPATDGGALRKAGLSYFEFDLDDRGSRLPVDPMIWGDVILQRKEVPTSYHLSVVVDDALQGVTHVVRGLDLQPATSIHRLLQILLGLPEPVYFHHGLIRDAEGRKLSKSDAATSLRSLRQAGCSRQDVLEKIGLAD